MIKLDLKTIRTLKTATYYNGANFSNYPNFFNSIIDYNTYSDDIETVAWKKSIFQKELLSLENVLLHQKQIYLTEELALEEFQQIARVISNAFGKSDTKMPNLFLIEKIPDEEISHEWSAMSIDKEDEKNIGIPQGIYFKKDVLTHGFFEPLIAHELIHWYISEFSKYMPFVPWIEEGICDILGLYFIWSAHILPNEAIQNFLIYNRVLATDELSKSYWKSCLSFINTLNYISIEEVVNILLSGRENIENLLTNSMITSSLNNTDFKNLIFYVLDIEQISIGEYCILSYINRGCNNKKDVLALTGMDKSEFNIYLLRLAEKGFIFIRNDNIYNPNKLLIKKLRFFNE